MDDSVTEYLDSIEQDLRAKKDRSEELDELFQLSFLGDDDTRERVSWCIAKMGQNKVPDMRILDILSSMKGDANPQVRENVVWGIGEVAGAGIGDDRSVTAVTELMRDPENNVRAMAVWAAGRLMLKLDMRDEGILSMLEVLKDDPSVLVQKSAEYALDQIR